MRIAVALPSNTDDIEPSDLDQEIFEQRLAGSSERSLVKRYGLPSREIKAAISRCVPDLNSEARTRALGIELARLDRLLSVFYRKAMLDGDVSAGALCLKIAERRACYLGLDIAPARDPVIDIEPTARPSSTTLIREAILRVVHEHQPAAMVNGAVAPEVAAVPPRSTDG